MESAILTERQRSFLAELGKIRELRDRYVLTGGTALAGFYYAHRLSEDLDFFSAEEIDTSTVNAFLGKIKQELRFDSFTSQQSFNRNIYVLSFPDGEQLKTEFTYFPFPPIEKPMAKEGVLVDSKIDLAVNKLFTIYQNPRSRDFIDLHLLMTREGYPLDELMQKARIKFDFHIDPLQLGAQLIRFRELKDLPHMRTPLDSNEIDVFFAGRAKGLKGQIIT